MIKERINKLGRQQIESAKEIIICNRNAYSIARLGDNVPLVDPSALVALVIFNNGNNQLVMAGDFCTWQFDDLKNGVRSIKRINKNVPISIYSDEQIIKFVATEKANSIAFMDAVKKFNQGEKSDLISILKTD